MSTLNIGKRGNVNSTPKQRNYGPYGKSANNFFSQGAGRNSYSRPYFSDSLILSRVSQYLQNVGRRDTVVDFDQMADDLQNEFLEYRRKKRSAFKHHLKKAVQVITFENSLNQEDSDLIDEYDAVENENVRGRNSPSYAFEGDGDVNSTLEDTYLQQNTKRRKVSETGPQELISIVTSDEDNNDDTSTKPAEVDNETLNFKTSFVDVSGRSARTCHSNAKSNEVPPPQKKEPPLNLNTEEVPSTPTVKVESVVPQTTKKRRAESALMGNKRFKSLLEPVRPTVSFKDIGGNKKVLQEVTQLLIHMRHPEVYRVLGVSPPRGFLLHGPPGSGKTLLAHAIAGELKLPLLKVAAPELVGGLSGQSEERIRELFEQAVALAPCILFIDEVDAITPNREMAHREMERRIVAQLLSSLDELANNENGDQVLVIGATNRPDSLDPALRRAGRFDREVCLGIPDRESRMSILRTVCQSLQLAPELQLDEVAMMTPGYVGADLKALVTEAAMAAVNRLFEALKESESKKEPKSAMEEAPTKDKISEQSSVKMDTVKSFTVDEENETSAKAGTKNKTKQPEKDMSESNKDDTEVEVVPLDNDDTNSDDVQVLKVESFSSNSKSAEFTPISLLHSAPLSIEQLQGVNITMVDFQAALKAVQPSAKREGFATVPDVKWDDIGSLKDIRQDLEMAILAPVKYPQEFATMGLHTPTGVLLCGPPGCGKTLLAKAVANEAGINFISVKGPELLNMYVGESERAVRQCFQRARSSQPCVIFFDEIDALCPKRTNMENGASRVVNQLLTEMDGMEARPGVFLMAATNRPDIVDPAVMRPGRLDKVLYVGLPAAEDRVDILRALTKGGKQPVLGDDVDLAGVGVDVRCEGYTGADLAALVREASMQALKEFMSSVDHSPADLRVCSRHFTMALEKIRPSVSERDKKRYEDLRLQYAAVPITG